jgi:hypothetical protein
MVEPPKLHAMHVLEEAAMLGKNPPDDGAKVAILPMGTDHPEGYQVLEIINGKINIDQFSDNECVEIIASYSLDFISYPDLNNFISSLASKVRKGGVIVLGGIDTYSLSRAITRDAMSIEEINNLLYSRKSLTDINTTKEFAVSLGLEIVSAHLNGINYEIKARRG